MSRPLVTDFALTTLASVGMTNTSTSFAVSAGTGAKFPSPSTNSQPNGRFVVAIDSELILCSGRSGDTFTVWTDSLGNTGRGYSNSGAASHSAGATVTLALPAHILNQLWGALADSFNVDVPVWGRGSWANGRWTYPTTGNAPGPYDEEFEGPYAGWDTPWSFSPRPQSLVAPDGSTGNNSGATVYWGTQNKSFLSFTRTAHNVDTWSLWRPFTPGTSAWTAQCKVHDFAAMAGLPAGASPTVEFAFFVSDQANPSAAPTGGNGVRIDHVLGIGNTLALSTTNKGAQSPSQPMWRGSSNVSSVNNLGAYALDTGEQYLQLDFDGSKTYHHAIGHHAGMMRRFDYKPFSGAFTPASIGFRWYIASSATNTDTQHSTLIDWIRTF